MSAYLDILSAKFPAGSFEQSEFRDNKRLVLPADRAYERLFPLLRALKEECEFDMLCDVAGIDYLNYPGATDRYCIVYALVNTTTAERVFVKAFTNDPDPELPSVVPLWAAADWMEREAYDLFGVRFAGHPDLRRLLLPDEFTSHPLRKDYPLRGHGERHNFQYVTRAEG